MPGFFSERPGLLISFGPIVFKDHSIIFSHEPIVHGGIACGPADLHCAEGFAQADRPGLRTDTVGDEMRPGQEIEEQAAENESTPAAEFALPCACRLG